MKNNKIKMINMCDWNCQKPFCMTVGLCANYVQTVQISAISVQIECKLCAKLSANLCANCDLIANCVHNNKQDNVQNDVQNCV